MPAGSRCYWFPRGRAKERFRPRRRCIPTDRPPTLSDRVHSLVPSVLFGVPSPALPVIPSSPSLACRPGTGDHSCQDFAPHRDITCGVHDPLARHAGFPGPASFRPRVFSTPRRLSPPPVPRACFIPPPRPGFCSVQGILPTRSGPSARRRGLPPCRSDSRAHRQAGCHARARRLRGIAPRIDAFRESGGLDLKRGRSPRRIQLLSQAPAPPP
jgi:hypothetical protein